MKLRNLGVFLIADPPSKSVRAYQSSTCLMLPNYIYVSLPFHAAPYYSVMSWTRIHYEQQLTTRTAAYQHH